MKVLIILLAVGAGTVASKSGKYMTDPEPGNRERDVHLQLCTDNVLYRCTSGQCIQREWVCDTETDCMDGSDEANCPTDCSGKNQFQCADNSTCLPAEFRCDDNDDCPDKSDEQNCHLFTCSDGEVKCANHKCMEKMWVCDGMDDCRDGSDEQNCTTCHAHNFRCVSTSTCISDSLVCDGYGDCQDKSDEANCDAHSTCHDKYSAFLCQQLNRTMHPICLNQQQASVYCQKFCHVCGN